MVPKVDWTPPRVQDLPQWNSSMRISVDVETKDPDLRDRAGHKGMGPGNFRPGNHICGVAFAIEDGPSYYLPVRHEGGDNLDPGHVFDYLKDQVRGFRGTIVGANLGYDLGFLEKDGVRFHEDVKHRDVISAAVLIYELHMRYSLDAILEREGLPTKDKAVLEQFASAYKINPIAELYKLPGRAAAAYGKGDVEKPLMLLRRQEKQIEAEEIQGIWDLETDVLPILVRLRDRGIRVDVPKIHAIISWAQTRAQGRLDEIASLTGVTVRFDEVWNAEAMARPFMASGIRVPQTTAAKPKPSITGPWMDQQGPVGKAAGRARDYSKLVQFAERALRYQINGRVHPVFHQLRNTKEDNGRGEENKGARFGRFSAEHQSIQQEPSRDDEFGEMWRSVYIPEDGEFWVCSDWSQQEPRIAVHYAELLGLPGAHDFANRYRSDPTTDCHQMMADITGVVRKTVKNYFNGCIYGMGEAKLCRAIGHPTIFIMRNGKQIEVAGPVGKKIIDQFKAGVPWVSLLTREAAKQMERVGHVWTIMRRKCHAMRDAYGNVESAHKAFSRIGQGGAADQMKATLVASHRAGIPVRLIVHDEFDFSTSSLKHVDALAELQRDTVKFNVPMLVDSEIGRNWGKMEKLSKLRKEDRVDEYLREMLAA